MSFPHVDPGFETFFEPTRIWLFGKPFESLRYCPESMGRWGEDRDNVRWRQQHAGEFTTGYGTHPLGMPPKRIERTLRRGVDIGVNGDVTHRGGEQQQFFARIYSFTYEAHYYRLPRPLLFLVNSPGEPMGGGRPEREPNEPDAEPAQRLSTASAGSAEPPPAPSDQERERYRHERLRARFSTKYTGVEARDWDFSNDIRVWAVDRKDLTVCLDVEIGNYQEILLDSMLARDRRDDDRATRSRGDLVGRGGGSFRGDMIGPHQNK